MKQGKTLLILIVFILIWQRAGQAQSTAFSNKDCAVSVDIWLLGESCVMAGLKARYGEYLSAWSITDADQTDPLAFILLRNRLFPITIASRPTDFGWIQGQPYIDFSLVDKIDTDNVDSNSSEGSILNYKTFAGIRVDQFLDTAALNELSLEGYPISNPRAQFIYQYFRIGYTFKTPWPFARLTYGFALGYHYFNLDFYYLNNDGRIRLSFFNANEEAYNLVQFFSLAAYEGESLNLMRLMLLTQDKVNLSHPTKDLTLNHLFLSLELLSWSFYF